MWSYPEGLVLIVALTAFAIGGVIKGAVGFGLPLLAIPAMTAAHSLPMALSIAVFPVVATNAWQLWAFREAHTNAAFLPTFLVLGLGGLAFGSVALSWVNDAYLEIALGGLVLTYLATELRSGGDRESWATTRLAPLVGLTAGAVHGATGLSGLVGTPYMHALHMPRPAFVFSNSAMFTMFSAAHAPILWGLGLYQPDAISVGLLTLPAAFAGLWLGGRLGARMRLEGFSNAVLVILTCSAIIPIWNGLRELLVT